MKIIEDQLPDFGHILGGLGILFLIIVILWGLFFGGRIYNVLAQKKEGQAELAKKGMSMESEFGTTGNVNWSSSGSAKVYDSNNNVIKCKCGKDADYIVSGKDCYVAYCSDCNPLFKETEAKFICKPPKE